MGYEKVIRSGSLLEYWSYERAPHQKGRTRQQIEKRASNRYRKHAVRREDNIRRLVKNFRRLIRSNLVGTENPSLLTLTMLQIVSLKTSSRLLTQFFVRVRGEYGKKVKFIAVPEFQKRGAVHYHVIIWGIPEEKIKSEYSTRALQRLWSTGFVDCIVTDGSIKLAGYLSKYMSKAMSDVRLGGEKAYHASRNILRPTSAAVSSFTDEEKELIGLNQKPTFVKKFGTLYLGQAIYQTYDIQNIDNIST